MTKITLSSINYDGQNADITLYGTNAIIYNIGNQTLPYDYISSFVYGTYVLTFPDLTTCEIFVPPPCEILFIENYTGQTNGVKIKYDSNIYDPSIYFDGSLENINYGDSIYIPPENNTGFLNYTPPIPDIYELTFTTLNTTNLDLSAFSSIIDLEIKNNNSLQNIVINEFSHPNVTGITLSNNPTLQTISYSYGIYFTNYINLKKLDVSFLPLMTDMGISNSIITELNITGTPLTYLDASYNNLSIDSQNHILKVLYENNIPNGYLDISYQTNNLCPDLTDPLIYHYYTGLTNSGWTISYGPLCNNFPPPPIEYGQPAFISKWKTETNGENIVLPLDQLNSNNFIINWGDGSPLENITSYTANTHTYATAGTYTVTISGTCKNWSFTNGGSSSKIVEILQWGNLKIKNSGGVFTSCQNLILTGVTDVLDLTNITNLNYTFLSCTSLTYVNNMQNWNVSNVTSMSGMFQGTQFNQPLSGWNVSNVTNMSAMFQGTQFNQNINNWNVSKVTDMSLMFVGTPFNQPLSGWNVGKVTNMSTMFGTTSFNQPIGNWNVSGVTNMNGMFYNAPSFNQPLSGWNVSNVYDMGVMFANTSFNQNINNWNVSNVQNIASMFSNTSSFNQPLSGWNVSNVTNMNSTFNGATSFNQNINNWNVSNVTSMIGTFKNTQSFNQPLYSWNVSNVQNMTNMFESAELFNQPLSSWNVGNVTNMYSMFANALSFNQNINNWNVSNVTDMSLMFGGTSFNQPLSGWNVGNVTNMLGMFQNASSFNQNINNWDVSKVTNMSNMFFVATSFDQPLDNWNITGVTAMINFMLGKDNTNYSAVNYDNILISWSSKAVKSNVTLNMGNIKYNSSSQASKDILTNTYNWTITDGGQV